MNLKLPFLCAALAALAAAGTPFGKPPGYLMGVNLAGAEFAGGVYPGVEDRNFCWPSEETLDYWHGVGVRLVRLPFKWERLQPELMQDFDPAYCNGLVRSIHRMRDRGMWVIPDVHNYAKYKLGDKGGKIGSEQVPYEAFADLWRRLALLLKDEPNIWGYGLMNEPQFAGDGGVDWLKCAQSAIDAIRKVDTQTMILVANDYAGWGATYQKEDTLADWAEGSMLIAKPSLLNDPSDNLCFELHTYFDHDNSGLYKHTYEADAARGTRVTPDVGVKRIKPFVKWLERHNARGFVGEFGCPANPDKDPRWLDALDNTLAYLCENRIPATLWAAGQMWTPGIGYVAERRGWSKDLPDAARQQHRPQTLLLQRYMDPPRITPQGEQQLKDHMERFKKQKRPAETADGFVLLQPFDELGVKKTPVFHLSKNWHRTWAGDSQFLPDMDAAYFLSLLKTPENQWGHETFYRNPSRFTIGADATAATFYFKVKIPEKQSQNVTLGLALDIDTGRSNKPEDVFTAALRVTPRAFQIYDAREDGKWLATDVEPKAGEWYGVWFVINNKTGHYDVYLDPGLSTAVAGAKQKIAGNVVMRTSARALDSFMLATHGKGAVFVADLYADTAKENLRQPNPAKPR